MSGSTNLYNSPSANSSGEDSRDLQSDALLNNLVPGQPGQHSITLQIKLPAYKHNGKVRIQDSSYSDSAYLFIVFSPLRLLNSVSSSPHKTLIRWAHT
jgi:hypothetical protein